MPTSIGVAGPAGPAKHPRRIDCAGCIAFDADARLLLIRRVNDPGAGLWSIPGGRCEPGESPQRACVRETAEETGLEVVIARYAGRVERAGPAGAIFDIHDYVCTVVGGELRAGDDASEARWASRRDLSTLELVPGLLEALAGWGELPG
jgi:8-oxo-dGTP diphosphatase